MLKHKGSVDINRPIDQVTQLFVDPQYLGEYQDGFERKEQTSGESGQNGAVSKLVYRYGKREMVLTETVVANNLPAYYEAFYHHKHMDNTMKCRFRQLTPNRTRYEYEFEYVRMSWVLPRLMAILFPGMYRKQGDKWMKQFKEFVEKQ